MSFSRTAPDKEMASGPDYLSPLRVFVRKDPTDRIVNTNADGIPIP
jgi:hypothetical protein